LATASTEGPSEQATEAIARKGFRAKVRGGLIAFEEPNFRLLFAGRVTSNMARQMRVFLRAWIVWETSGSPFLLGFVTSSLAWPMLFMPFVGGFLADKIDRRRLLKYTESLLVVLWASVAFLVYFEYIQWWHFVISSVLSGVIQSIGRPGHQAILGSIVDKERLPNAVALDSIADTWPRVAGPAVGGLLIGAIGTGWLFWMTSLGQLFTAITIFLLRWNPEEQRERQRRAGHSGSFFEGFKHVWREKVLFGLIGLGVAFAMIGGSAMFMMPIFADAILGVGGSGLGAIMTVSTIGASMGGLAVVFLSNFRHRGYVLFAVAMLNAVVIVAFSRSEIFLVSLVFVFGMGMAQVMFRTMRIVAMQILTPDDLRGRVMSFQTTVQGMTWIGVLIMGSLAEGLSRRSVDLGFMTLGGDVASGAADTVLISGILYGIISLAFFTFSPALRRFK
jgi:MFS family permease